MLRLVLGSVGMIALLGAQTAFAHPEPQSPVTAAETAKNPLKMPTESEIEDLIEKMPNFNGILGDMAEVMKDEKLRSQLQISAEAFSKSLEKSGAFETKDGELPDINSAIAVLLRSLGDKDGLGGMITTMTDMAETLDQSLEKHMPEEAEP
jgi:hypothetical protein